MPTDPCVPGQVKQFGDAIYACFGNAQWTFSGTTAYGITLADLQPIKQQIKDLQLYVALISLMVCAILFIVVTAINSIKK